MTELKTIGLLLVFNIILGILIYNQKQSLKENKSRNFENTIIPYKGRIQIQNGSSYTGIAAKLAEFLRKRGYVVYSPENARFWTHKYTVVLALDGNLDFARKVAKELNTNNYFLYRIPNSYFNVRIIIGKDIYSLLNKKELEGY